MDRPWLEDEKYREQLQNKIDNDWFVVVESELIIGQVISIVYNGYKIAIDRDTINSTQLTGRHTNSTKKASTITINNSNSSQGISTVILNPNQCTIQDVDANSYAIYKAMISEKLAEVKRLQEQQKKEADDIIKFQSSCLHSCIDGVEDNSNTVVVLRTYTKASACCDIIDYSCSNCEKLLRTSYATAYDNDPKDLINDWEWFKRYHLHNYKCIPLETDYNING